MVLGFTAFYFSFSATYVTLYLHDTVFCGNSINIVALEHFLLIETAGDGGLKTRTNTKTILWHYNFHPSYIQGKFYH